MIRAPIRLTGLATLILLGTVAAVGSAWAQTPGDPYGLRAAPAAGLLTRDAMTAGFAACRMKAAVGARRRTGGRTGGGWRR